MAISVSKKKSRPSKRVVQPQECSFYNTILFKFLYRIPATVLVLFLIFLWSSSTTIISGKIVHICISSRKVSNLYCLSAGTQATFEIPIPITTNNGTSNFDHSGINDNIDHSGIINGNIVQDDSDDELANAAKVVEEQLQIHRSWAVSDSSNSGTCSERGIFVYDLPPKFNKDLMGYCNEMVPWIDLCNYFKNGALGEPLSKLGKGWYNTHQYALEPIFHSRVLNHPCRVFNENEAKLFYVPFYGGLDILRWHFKNVSSEVKDILALDLVKWLESQQSWKRNSGEDHVFVLGKVSWDFRRNNKFLWGTKFLEFDQLQKPIKLLIERQPWHLNDIGIPHPTHFHPHSDEEIINWQSTIIRSSRKNLVSFAGAARPGAPENIRSVLIKQCISSLDHNRQCKFLDCRSGGCDQPELVIELFMESEFCLQPPGDSPTRKSVFDSLVSGCIPVLFDPFTAYYQYPWHLPEDHGKYSVFIDQQEVRDMKVNVVEKLMKISVKERDDMRRYIVYELLPRLLYGDSSSKFDKFQDAFSITINNLLERMSKLESVV